MNRFKLKSENLAQRKQRVRARVSGTTTRPRLSIVVSNAHVSAQVIDDSKGVTLVAASSIGSKSKGTMTEKASSVGADIAKKAKAVKIKHVAFDRNGRLYHGRVKALADAARAEGLEF